MRFAFLLKTVLAICFTANAVSQEPEGPHVVNVYNYGSCCNDGVQTVIHEKHIQNISTTLENLKDTIVGSLEEVNSKCKPDNQANSVANKPRDCQDLQAGGLSSTGIYRIYPDGTDGIQVRCDMDTTNGGWTVFQRRVSDSDFYKTWTEYQFGFGNLSENFWLGNQQIHTISSQGWYQLRIDLGSKDGGRAFAEYKLFKVGDSSSAYQLTAEGYSGNAGDSLAHHNGRKFSTKDRDNDNHSIHCAQSFKGAWWYGGCHDSNLNGDYGNAANAEGPVWEHWKGNYEPLTFTEMKLRRWRD